MATTDNEGVLIQLSIALALVRNKLIDVHNDTLAKLEEHKSNYKKGTPEYKELYSLMKSWAESVKEPLDVSEDLKKEVDRIMGGQNV